MPWFRVDDTFHAHPKTRRAGLSAIGLWTVCGSYSMAYKLDGFVPAWLVKDWRGNKEASRLVEAGKWLESEREGEPGFQFHDWSDWQMTASEIELEREMNRERQRKYRERRRAARKGATDDE